MKKPIPLLSDTPAVIAAIDSEIAYQNRLTSSRTDDRDHGVAGQIVTLNTLVGELNKAWYGFDGDERAIHMLRKIAASAARGLILYGVSPRLRNGENGIVEQPEYITHEGQ